MRLAASSLSYVCECIGRGAALTLAHRLKPTANALDGFRAIKRIEECLISGSVLNDDFRRAIDGKHLRKARLLQALDVFASVSLEIGKGADIVQTNHETSPRNP